MASPTDRPIFLARWLPDDRLELEIHGDLAQLTCLLANAAMRDARLLQVYARAALAVEQEAASRRKAAREN